MLDEIALFFRRNAAWLATLAAAALAAYGHELFSFNLTIDEELHGASPTPLWLGDGRWMMWLLNWILLPTAAIPTLPILVGLAGITAGLVLSLRLWIPNAKPETILAACVALTFPTLIFNLAFAINAYGIGVGFLATMIAARLAGQTNWQSRALSIVLLTLSFAIYQSFVFVAITSLLALTASAMLCEPSSPKQVADAMRRLAYSLVVVGVAVIAYLLISSGVRAISQLWFPASDYLATTYFQPHLILQPWIWRWSAESIAASYVGLADYYSRPHWSLGMLMVASIAALLRAAISSSRKHIQLAALLVLFAAILFAPFSLYPISGPSLPARALLALPVAVMAICALAIQISGNKLRLLLSILAGLTAFHNAAIINQYTATSEMSLAADRALGAALLSAIAQQPHDKEQVGPTRIAVVGAPLREIGSPAMTHDILGASFFDWGGGEASRAVAFMRTLGLEGAISASELETSEIISLQAAMPQWPNDGSVIRKGDLVIIKFGEFTRKQRKNICGIVPETNMCREASP